MRGMEAFQLLSNQTAKFLINKNMLCIKKSGQRKESDCGETVENM